MALAPFDQFFLSGCERGARPNGRVSHLMKEGDNRSQSFPTVPSDYEKKLEAIRGIVALLDGRRHATHAVLVIASWAAIELHDSLSGKNMKIRAPCAICVAKIKDPHQLKLLDGELDDSGVVFVDCPDGHRTAVLYDSRRYELLMLSCAMALLDGYTNEAISSFAAALERAYEFYMRVILRQNGIQQSAIDEAWKAVAAQSERQFGGFHFLYLVDNAEPLNLNEEIMRIRNRIIHRGHIARTEEALKYAKMVFERIKDIETALKQYQTAVQKEVRHEIESQQSSVPANMETVELKAFSVRLDENGNVIGMPETFEEYLVSVQRGKDTGFL
jgi:hypothetical protein